MSRTQLLRLGLFQLAAGVSSVLFLGVLNRVMRVEMGLNLFLVSLLVGGGHYLGALVAIPAGNFSDSHRLVGYRRTAYALGGAAITGLVLAFSPWIARWISASPSVLTISVGFLFFLLEGVSTFIAGTAYLALIVDRATEKQRGPVTGVVWTLLMVGLIAAGIVSGIALREYTFTTFSSLLVFGAVLAGVLSLLALVGQERRERPGKRASESPLSMGQAVRLLLSNQHALAFAAFLMVGMFSYFMQDVVLEPFGGDVFGLTAAQTSRFNAYMGIGVIAGMLAGGMWLIPRQGKCAITAAGCWLMVLAFAGLALSAFANQPRALSGAITFLGLGAGFFTVGGVSLMMDMTSAIHTGLFAGAWTLVQAVAKGPASITGGAIQSILEAFGATQAQAYGAVFSVEAIGLLLAILLLSRVQVKHFRTAIDSFGKLAAQTMD